MFSVSNAAAVHKLAGDRMSQHTKSPSIPAPSRSQGVPVYVMLPLDTVSDIYNNRCDQITCVKPGYMSIFTQVNRQGSFQYATTSWFARALGLLQASGVEGVAVDVWVSALLHCLHNIAV